jgi:hypothetical protein
MWIVNEEVWKNPHKFVDKQVKIGYDCGQPVIKKKKIKNT